MSNTEFRERLSRIGASSTQRQSMAGDAGVDVRSGPRRPNYLLVGAGGAIMVLGLQAVKFANQNYEAIRDANGPGLAAGVGLGGMVFLLFGVVVMMRAAFGRRSRASARDLSTTERKGRILFSLLGFVFGAIASLSMFIRAAAKFIEGDNVQAFVSGSAVIALSAAFASLLLGLIGLFARGYALGRVPVYFLFGGVLTYAAVRILRVNLLEWPQFVTLVRGAG